MKDLKNNKTFNLIIEIILIIIIIILLIHSCVLQKKNNQKTPTGNVDIIEIKCDNTNTCTEVINKDDNKKSNIPSTIIKPVDNQSKEEPKEIEPTTGLVVVDKYTVKWDGKKDLKIFTNSAYELTDRISPESSNTYKFVVKNKTAYKLNYKITFIETNKEKINMKYKLKKNNNYIVDEYTTYKNLDISNQEIEAGGIDTYYLDWKWFSSSNDTHVGEIQANYDLKIEIEAESVLEEELDETETESERVKENE